MEAVNIIEDLAQAAASQEVAMILKQERARITRNRIVSSASNSFHHHGFAKASLSDIIEDAGVTKGALYFHFESKEDVAGAVLDAHIDLVADHFAELLESGLPPLAMLVQLCSLPTPPARDAQDTPAGFRLAAELAHLHPALSHPFYYQWLQMITLILRRAEASGILKPGIDPDTLGMNLLDSITGAELLFNVMNDGGNHKIRSRELWQLLIPQIVAEGQLPSLDELLETVPISS